MLKDFCKDWTYFKVGEKPIPVNLPHDAMLYEKRSTSCLNGDKSGYFPGGKYVYEKIFTINKTEIGQYVALLFEGVYQNVSITVNRKNILHHAYGYTEFTVDISDVVIAGENKIAVTVDNSLEPNSRWYSGSGIYRPVSLIVKDKRYISELRIVTKTYRPAVIEISAQAENAQVEILKEDRIVVSGALGKMEIPDAELWSAEEPNLYTCVVRTATDEVREQFGIRKIEWSAKTGLLINGIETLLRGGCIHHDNGILGACAFADAEERRVRILKEAGYNAIRSAHNPCSRALLEACDRLGMYIMDEAFDGWYTPKTYHDYSRNFYEEYKNDLTAMVKKDINHPSVIMYSIGNEVSETASPKGASLAGEMSDQIRSLDPTRPVTCGINVTLNIMTASGHGVYKDNGEYKAEPLPPLVEGKRKKEKETGSAFFNALMQKLGWYLNYKSGTKKGDIVIRDTAAKLDIVGLNYASTRYEKDSKNYPDRMIVGSETMVGDLPKNWEYVKNNRAIIGDFVWVAFDYLGEAGVGEWRYYSNKGLPLTTGSGTIDLIGTIGAESYFQQVVWGTYKKPYICVRPVTHSHERPKTGSWRFTDAIDSWSWQGCEGKKAVVEVFSDAYRIKLLLNGKVLDEQKVKNYKTLFKTEYQPGTLEAVTYDSAGKKLSRSSLTTAEHETVITLTPEKKELKANGQDLCFIPITLTDQRGTYKPAKDIRINVKVEGAGVLQGLGSAICTTDEVFDKTYHNTHYGRALAVIRAGYDPGKVKVSVSAESLDTQVVEIEVS